MAPYRFIPLLMLALGSGVDADPVNNAGLWHPTGANAVNIATMAASPQDLIRGRGETSASGRMSAIAIARLQQDKVKPLPALSAESRPGADLAPSNAAPVTP